MFIRSFELFFCFIFHFQFASRRNVEIVVYFVLADFLPSGMNSILIAFDVFNLDLFIPNAANPALYIDVVIFVGVFTYCIVFVLVFYQRKSGG